MFRSLGLKTASPIEKYAQLDKIVVALKPAAKKSPKGRPGNAGVMGALSEQLCRLGLDASGVGYRKLSSEWQWLADFALDGNPFSVLVSVKSFSARERFIMSGVRSLIVPTVGWGLFDNPKEWNESRARSYVFSGFACVYLPGALLEKLKEPARLVRNANGNPLLRNYLDFVTDIKRWQDGDGRVDVRRI